MNNRSLDMLNSLRNPYAGMSGMDKIPKGYKAGQLGQFTPEQLELFYSLFPQYGEDSSLYELAMGQPGAYDQMELPALQQFGELQGNLASRFSGMGMGGRRSSGFQNQASQAAQQFAQQLAANRYNVQRQAQQDLMGGALNLLNLRPSKRFLSEKKPGFDWGGALGMGAGAIGGFYTGGPMGALKGASMGYNVGSGLTGR